MRTRPSAFVTLGLASFIGGCQGETSFKGTGKLGGSIDATKASVVWDPGGLNRATSTPGDGVTPGGGSTTTDPSELQALLILPCAGNEPNVVSTKVKALHVPVVCSKEETMPAPQYTDMDLVFVLDTTGSMQPYVKMVRDNIQAISAAATRNGYAVRFGAISFGDKIYDSQPLTTDAAALLAAMADTNPAWKPVDARGGLATEIGLGAIEEGLRVLGAGPSHSKTLVYFSDGPAKRAEADRDSLEASFSIATTAKALAEFTRQIQEQAGMFRLISGTGCARGDSWYPEWPTPCLQAAALAQTAGVRHLPMTFPMKEVGYDTEFLARVDAKPTTVITDCVLTSIAVRNGGGEAILPEFKISASDSAQAGLWSAPVQSELPAGEYVASVKRTCKGNVQESSFKVSVK